MKEKHEAKYFVWFAALLLLVALAVLLLLPVWREYRGRTRELARQEQQSRILREELKEKLAETAALENSADAVEKVAREKYRQVRDNETIMTYPVPQRKKSR